MKTTYTNWMITAILGFILTAFIAGTPLKFLGYGFVYIILTQIAFFMFNSIQTFQSINRMTQMSLLAVINLGIATLFTI